MLKSLKYVLFLPFLMFVSSCFKDVGNYEYSDINQIEITSDTNTYTLLQQDTLNINIDLSQTLPGNKGLSYEWVLYPASSTPLTRRILDTTQNLNAIISELPDTYTLDYFVKDKETGVSFMKRFTVVVVSAFSEGWLVMEESGEGVDLALIAANDRVFRNIYSTTNGEKLPSGTREIAIFNNRNQQEIFVLSPHDMIQVHYVDFLKIGKFSDFFYSAPQAAPEAYFMKSYDKRLVNNGQVFSLSTIFPPPYFFGLPLTGPGTYEMEPYEIRSVRYGFFFYDKISQAFYRSGSYDISFSSFGEFNPGVDSFDMNHVGKQLLYAENNVAYLHYALFKNNDDDSLFIYGIDAGSSHPAVSKYDVSHVSELLDADHFRMSQSLSFLYFSNGNKMYKLDILAQSATLLYTFPSGTEVADIQMYDNIRDREDPDNNQMLVIGTNEGVEGKVYLFPLAATGNFVNDTYRKVYTGFNHINGLAFKFKK